jgi:ubiquinone/menaquinone biosynthesis C-methylase UbiE
MKKLYDALYLRQLHELLRSTKLRTYELLAPDSNDRICDVGCGIGLDAAALAASGATVIGIDNDIEFISTAHSLLSQGATRPMFLCADACCTPFEGESFTKLRFDRVFQHIPEATKIMREARRIVCRDGLIQIFEPDYLSMTFFHPNIRFERKLFDAVANERIPNAHKVRSLPHELTESGFEVLRVDIVNHQFHDINVVKKLIRFDLLVNDLAQRDVFTEEDAVAWRELCADGGRAFTCSLNFLLIMGRRTS